MTRRTGSFIATFVPSVLLVLTALAFSAGVNIGSFRRDSSDALFSTFTVAGRKVVSNIEYAVKYGKPIDNFYGMERILGQLRTYLPQVNGVAVALPDGQVTHALGIYSFAGQVGKRLTGFERRQTGAEFTHSPSFHYHDTDSRTYKLFLPIRSPKDQSWIGTLVIAASDAVIADYVGPFEAQSLAMVTALGAVSVLLLAGLAVARRGQAGGGRDLSTLAIVAAAQIAAGVEGYTFFRDAYVQTAETTTQIVKNIIAADLASVTERGVSYAAFSGIDNYFKEITAIVPHIKRIELDIPDAPEPADPLGYGRAAEEGDIVSAMPLPADADLVAPALKVVIDHSDITAHLMEIVVNNLAILIMSLMFMFEIHILVMSRLKRQAILATAAGGPGETATMEDGEGEAATATATAAATATATTTNAAAAAADGAVAVASMRFLTFSLYFGMFLSASFVPVMMKTFDQSLFDLPSLQAAAAPVSVEMLCGALAIALISQFLGAARWRPMVATGLAMAACGALASGVAWHPLLFVAARGCVGAGSMLALMGIYRLIGALRQLDPETGAYSDMFSGMYVGVNCGAVAGGLLAGEIGTRAVFLIAGGVLAFALVQVLLVMPGVATGKPARPAPRPAAVSPLAMSDLPTLAFLLLVSVPTSACSMFLIYYFPVYASSLGQPPATIGHAFLLYGLCIVYLGPVLSRWMRTTTLAPRWPVVLSGLVMAAGLTTFALTDSLWSAFLAILLLGLADCIGLPAQQNYLEGLPVVARHGLAVPQSYHLNARKAGQIVGPMLFSAAALTGGEGIALLSSGLAVGLLFFLIQSLRMARPRLTANGVS